ncbi:MAG: SDR family oxidoreductase [Myxococcota bacterium]|nr:SDR family oxidoreductase [Myxococcota bacterium]
MSPLIDLEGRRAFISGSLERTGLGIAEHLARCGASIILHGRNDDERAQDARTRLAAISEKQPTLLFGDISDPSVCERLAEQTGALDILVNNVGVYAPKDLAETDASHWRWTMTGNLDVTFFMAQAFLPALLKGGNGRLIQIGFTGCDRLRPTGQATAYQIAKTGVHLLSQSYAKRYAHRGLTSNTVSPGQLENSIDLPSAGKLPSGRAGRIDEVAGAVAFLASRKADYINGTNINIAGGWEPQQRPYED